MQSSECAERSPGVLASLGLRKPPRKVRGLLALGSVLFLWVGASFVMRVRESRRSYIMP